MTRALLTSALVVSAGACGETSGENAPLVRFGDLTGEYAGQPQPGRTPQQFLPDVITEEVHSTTVFSPDGSEVYWTPMERGTGFMRFMRRIDHVWTAPEVAYFGGSDDAGEPCFSADGSRLYFTSFRTPNVADVLQKENIWYVERAAAGWGDPVVLGAVVNDLDLHWTFSIADNGNLYYAGHPISEPDQNDIFVAENEGGAYAWRVRLGGGINTGFSEDTPFVAPDESYLLFARVGPGSLHADLHICFQSPTGQWNDPINMTSINTSDGHELAPHVTRDGRFLFFMSSRSGESKPYWVSAEVIEELR